MNHEKYNTDPKTTTAKNFEFVSVNESNIRMARIIPRKIDRYSNFTPHETLTGRFCPASSIFILFPFVAQRRGGAPARQRLCAATLLCLLLFTQVVLNHFLLLSCSRQLSL